jgi:hypothetical protein
VNSDEGVLLVVVHPVEDYARWKEFFDGLHPRRAEAGASRHWVYQAVDDPNEVLVAVQLPSREAAESFIESEDEVRAWAEQGGVKIYPPIFIGAMVEETAYPPG